jgi:hypothetical protein
LIEKETEMRWVVFSNSLSSLQDIGTMYPKTNSILTEIQEELAVISENKLINFVWTAGHPESKAMRKQMKQLKRLYDIFAPGIDSSGGRYDTLS